MSEQVNNMKINKANPYREKYSNMANKSEMGKKIYKEKYSTKCD